MGRPQGEAIRVFLDTIPGNEVPDQDVLGDIPGDVLTEVPSTSRQDVPNVPDRAQAMATYNRELIEPLVEALERSQATVREQAETIGRQAAELERAASTIVRLGDALEAHSAAQNAEAPMEPPTSVRAVWARWWPLVASLLVLLAASVLLVVPR